MPLRRDFALTLASLLAAGPASSLEDEPPLWVSAEVPPFVWKGAHGPQGYAYEIHQRVCRQAGLPTALRFYPWARAMQMLQRSQAYGGLVVARSPEREASFHWLFPVGSFRFAIFTRPQDGPVTQGIEGLRNRRVGLLRASASRELLVNADPSNIVEGKDYRELLALLQRGVVDVILGPAPVVRALTVDSRPPLNGTLLDHGLPLYAVASPSMPADVRQRLVKAYQQLVDNGAVAQLRRRHPEASFDD